VRGLKRLTFARLPKYPRQRQVQPGDNSTDVVGTVYETAPEYHRDAYLILQFRRKMRAHKQARTVTPTREITSPPTPQKEYITGFGTDAQRMSESVARTSRNEPLSLTQPIAHAAALIRSPRNGPTSTQLCGPQRVFAPSSSLQGRDRRAGICNTTSRIKG
jgi:hypothetical protein